MPIEINPYQPPSSDGETLVDPQSVETQAPSRWFSVLMIGVGVFFGVLSLWAVSGELSIGFTEGFSDEWFPTTYLFFYGIVGCATAAFHASYLRFGWPSQVAAGLYAIGLGLLCAAAYAGIMIRFAG